MDLIAIVKLAWRDTTSRLLFPGLMLCMGVGLAVLPHTGGRLVCDRGMCVQERTAALGTVRDAIMYPTSEIEAFRVERDPAGELARVVIELRGQSEPLTVPFTMNGRDVDRIAAEGSRFLDEGAGARFVAAQEVQGLRSFLQPLALALLIGGAGLAGWVMRSVPSRRRWA